MFVYNSGHKQSPSVFQDATLLPYSSESEPSVPTKVKLVVDYGKAQSGHWTCSSSGELGVQERIKRTA